MFAYNRNQIFESNTPLYKDVLGIIYEYCGYAVASNNYLSQYTNNMKIGGYIPKLDSLWGLSNENKLVLINVETNMPHEISNIGNIKHIDYVSSSGTDLLIHTQMVTYYIPNISISEKIYINLYDNTNDMGIATAEFRTYYMHPNSPTLGKHKDSFIVFNYCGPSFTLNFKNKINQYLPSIIPELGGSIDFGYFYPIILNDMVYIIKNWKLYQMPYTIESSEDLPPYMQLKHDADQINLFPNCITGISGNRIAIGTANAEYTDISEKSFFGSSYDKPVDAHNIPLHDTEICIVNYDSKQVQILKGHTHAIYGLCELSDNRLLSCSLDNTVRIWDLSIGICEQVIQLDLDNTKVKNGIINSIYKLKNNMVMLMGEKSPIVLY